MTASARTATLADDTAPLREVVAQCRVRDAVTGAPLDTAAATLTWQVGDGPEATGGTVPVRLARRPGGWCALHLVPSVALPDLAGAAAGAGVDTVTLTARVSVEGREPAQVSRQVPASQLALEDATVVAAGSPLTVRRVAGPPVDLGVAVPPRPVGLRGVVLRDHDPARPVAGATVAVTGGPTATADGGGRFVVDALPLAPVVEVTVTDGVETVAVTVRPDYERPVQLLTVSLPG